MADDASIHFKRDFIIGLASAAVATIVFTTIICVLAHCGPRLCGSRRTGGSEREVWFRSGEEDVEKGRDMPFVQSSMALNPAYR